jgi:hypothetical protein
MTSKGYTSPEQERVDAYRNTIERLEPDIAMVDREAALASIAISLRRLADIQHELLALAQRAENPIRELIGS